MIVYIQGNPVFAIADSVVIDDRVLERSIARFRVRTNQFTYYVKGMPVKIRDEDGNLQFAGFIETSERVFGERDDPDGEGVALFGWSSLLYDITCVDLHYCADKRIVARAYVNQTAGSIVRDLVSNSAQAPYLAGEGVQLGDIRDGLLMEAAAFNYVYASRALDRLAEANNFYWRIRPNGQLDFRPRNIEDAPFTITSDDVDMDTVRVTDGNPLYRNRQFLRGVKDITDLQVETRKGDGATRTWEVSYPIAQEPTIRLNGVVQNAATEVGIRGVESGASFKFFWNKGDRVISHSDDFAVLTASDTIQIDYYGEFDIVLVTHNQSEIDARKVVEGSTSGIVDHVETASDITGRTNAAMYANGLLATYGYIGRSITFEIYREGLEPGQQLTVNIPELGLYNVKMLIESVTERDF